jgi:translation initiation factor 2B subunit (eIF-2B alpha/beta/delta family)/ADP-ribose pyrophosphatase YjhB (NUDIX family)
MAEPEPDLTPVVTAFLRNDCAVLLLRRSEAVGSHRGRWGAVAGHLRTRGGADREPVDAALKEIREETGLAEHVRHVRTGEPFEVRDEEGDWLVHPVLFDCDSREVETDEETGEWAWVPPTEILRLETAPDLWTSYDRVRPTPGTVAGDTEHGSAYLSLRALECLRDTAALAAETGDGGSLADLARTLLAARSSMAVVTNRVNRTMSRADPTDSSAVERAAASGIEGALRADDRAARWVEVDPPASVLTLSRSGTVLRAIERASPERVYVAESRPAREGVGVAESLSAAREVRLHTDAAVGHVLAAESVDAVVVGADAVLADGSVVNKTGTRLTALAAARERVPVYVVCAADKVSPDKEPTLESGPLEAVYDGDADLTVLNPTFDVTPLDLVTALLTDRGALDADDVREVAEEHARLAEWSGDGGTDPGGRTQT